MIVFDITNRTSFENVEKWINLTKMHTSKSNNIILIGNKVDIHEKRQVSVNEAKEYAGIILCLSFFLFVTLANSPKKDSKRIIYVETSAKDLNTIEKAFNILTSGTFEIISLYFMVLIISNV